MGKKRKSRAIAIRNILCVDSTDTCRAPALKVFIMQELFSNGHKFNVASAGIGVRKVREKMDATADRLLQEVGLGLMQHRSQRIDEIDLNSFQLVLCVDAEVRDFLRTSRLTFPRARIELINPEEDGVSDPKLEPAGRKRDKAYEACLQKLSQVARAITGQLEL